MTDAERVSKSGPQSSNSLIKRLKKIEPALRACGIGVEFDHSGNRTITLTWLKLVKYRRPAAGTWGHQQTPAFAWTFGPFEQFIWMPS